MSVKKAHYEIDDGEYGEYIVERKHTEARALVTSEGRTTWAAVGIRAEPLSQEHGVKKREGRFRW